MKVRVFTEETMQEAMAKVKIEMGADAVILHTRHFRKGGIFGHFGKEMVEVTAAIEDPPKSVERQVMPGTGIMPKNVLKRYEGISNNAEAALNTDTKVNSSGDTIVDVASFADIAEKAIREKKQKKQLHFKKHITIKAKKNTAGTVKNEEKDQQISQLQSELSDMKKMLEQVITSAGEKNGSDSVMLKTLLEDNEVENNIVDEIVNSILDEAVLNNKDLPETTEFLVDYFEKTFRPARGIELEQASQKVVALIGATGVGKTTTIAKLAAKFVLEKSCRVALITADTYRISAVEQLKTYSDIVGVPLEIVYTPAELKAAIAKHDDKDLILIDTAGRSQHNQFQLEELKEMLNVNKEIEKHLVMSSTTKYRDAVDILRKFAICEPDKVLFTKVDETSSIGLIINLCYHYPITLSYLTNGQSVPDDIVLGDPVHLAKFLLR